MNFLAGHFHVERSQQPALLDMRYLRINELAFFLVQTITLGERRKPAHP